MSTSTDHRPQSLAALDRANEIRVARAELKRAIAAGEIAVAAVLSAPPVEAHSWAVGQLLRAPRGWGAERSRRVLSKVRIGENRPVGDLTERQRALLASTLGARSAAGQRDTV